MMQVQPTGPKMIDVTGKHVLVPACPKHKDYALIPEPRPTIGGKQAMGFWRCPIDNKVYTEELPMSPALKPA